MIAEELEKNGNRIDGRVPGRVVLYTLAFTVLAASSFITLLAFLPSLQEPEPGRELTHVFVMTIATMAAAGALGGCLYNFRGLTKHSTDQDFSEAYNLSYYLSPIAGAISGLLVFFLLMGGALTLSIGTNGGGLSWSTFSGRMPYIAFGILAGYGSREFTLKLKDIAESLFALAKRS